MVARTAQFMGVVYSTGSTISIEVEYNNVIVYSGNLVAVTQDSLPPIKPVDVDPTQLFTFETDTDITGQIPMTITVTGGTCFFSHIWMNYTGNAIFEPDPANPGQFIVTPVPPVDFIGDPNTNTIESDGVNNLEKNGIAWTWRTNVGDLLGDWSYPIYDGETLSFDFFVDPAKVVIDPFVPSPLPGP